LKWKQVSQNLFIREMPNGMTLLGQPMEGVSSAAMTLLVPLGSAHDPAGLEGGASILCEWMFRGAGDMDSRRLNDALDELGAEHSECVLSEHLQFSSAQLGVNLHQVLRIYADIIRRPTLDDAAFEPCRELTLADLESLEDEPARKCSLLLAENFYPWPLGRSIYGSRESLCSASASTLRSHALGGMSPRGAIIAVAGNIDWPAFCAQTQDLFEDWRTPPQDPINVQPARRGCAFLKKDSSQVYISLAHKSVTVGHKLYYAARLAESVLSGGMSSRLMDELRDKRGLVYSVNSRYHSLKEHAGIFTTAGTTPQRAQQTLDVMIDVMARLGEGVTDEELARSKAQLKSFLIMQGESTSSRSAALAGDWYFLRRLRTLDELSSAVDSVTTDELVEYATQFPARDFTVVLVGPDELKLPRGARHAL